MGKGGERSSDTKLRYVQEHLAEAKFKSEQGSDLYSKAHVSVLATNQTMNSERVIPPMREVTMNNYKHAKKLTNNPCRQLIAGHFIGVNPVH